MKLDIVHKGSDAKRKSPVAESVCVEPMTKEKKQMAEINPKTTESIAIVVFKHFLGDTRFENPHCFELAVVRDSTLPFVLFGE